MRASPFEATAAMTGAGFNDLQLAIEHVDLSHDVEDASVGVTGVGCNT